MAFVVGSHVRRRGSDVVGVYITDLPARFARVSFPEGVREVPVDSLELLERDGEQLLAAGETQDSELHIARVRAIFLKHAFQYDEAAGLSNSRIEPAHHQVFVAHRVIEKLLPRMILADEVGLGKTVEAGLILKELRARGLVSRALVIVPASLTEQWRGELERKFNERFTIVDGPTLKLLRKRGENPWLQLNNAICSLPLVSRENTAEELLEAGWDLVIFDEAHRVRRTQRGGEQSANLAYRLADGIKLTTDGLLLLTATPVQLHQFELYSLIELVEPGLFSSYADFEAQHLQLPWLNTLMQRIYDWNALDAPAQAELQLEVADLLDAEVGDLDDEHIRDATLTALAERHPLANVMVRNRKKQVGIVSERLAHLIRVDMSEVEADLYREVTEYLQYGYSSAMKEKNNVAGFVMVTYQKMLTSSSTALRKSLQRRADQLRTGNIAKKTSKSVDVSLVEEAEDPSLLADQLTQQGTFSAHGDEILHLEELVKRLAKVQDSKAAVLLEVCESIFEAAADNKAVIFTQFRETQNYLQYALRQNGYAVEVFHGGLKPDEKEEAIHRFRETAQILVSTEAGGEGRNLQFCHHLINYDLPWNPMRIEQRIGRLDRFGQRHPVSIYNLYYADTLEARVLDVLSNRIKIFEESVGALDPILGEFEQIISRVAMAVDRAAAERELDAYADEVGTQVARARERERVLADFALDRMSLRRDDANRLLDRRPVASNADLRLFVQQALDRFGGSLYEHQGGGWQVTLSPALSSRLKAGRSSFRGSFEPSEALTLEDLDFFALGHEMIDRLLDFAIAQPGALVGGRDDPSLRGGLFVETVYRVAKSGLGPRAEVRRHLVDDSLAVRSESMTAVCLKGPAVDLAAPPWAEAALAASRRTWDAERSRIYDEFAASFEDERRQRLERARRLSLARERRDREIESQLGEWLDTRNEGMSSRDQRILPANRKRLLNVQDRLARAQEDLIVELEKIESESPAIEFELLWVGLVRGTM